jgi:simple sugar transport system ATP-binding protein
VVFISHKLDEVLAVADRITVMRRGQVVGVMDAAETTKPALARMMVGRELAAFVEHPADEGRRHAPPGEAVLELRAVGADGDKGLPALTDVSFSVRAGEIVGVAGVAGNGQRELAEAITGLRPATAGEIRVAGRDVTNRPPAAIAREGVAHVPEDRLATGLIAGLDVAGNAILRGYREPPLARGPFLRSGAIAAFADRLIGRYDVKTPSRRTRVRLLSGGNQQKLLIGRELEGNPRLVVAVHPTRGVDIGATEAIHDLIDTQKRRGAAILLISEDLDELMALADRIVVLFGGRVIGDVPARTTSEQEIGLMMAGIQPQPEGAPAHG